MHLRHLTIYCKHAEAFRSLSLSQISCTRNMCNSNWGRRPMGPGTQWCKQSLFSRIFS